MLKKTGLYLLLLGLGFILIYESYAWLMMSPIQRKAYETSQVNQYEFWTSFIRDLFNFFTTASYVVLYSCTSAFLLTVTVMVYWVISHRQESSLRIKNGSYPLIVSKKQGRIMVLDPNNMPLPDLQLDTASGRISMTHEIQPDDLLDMAHEAQRTRTIAALGDQGGFRYAATGKYLSGFYDKGPMIGEETEEPTEPVNLLTLDQAFEQSKREAWILGQNRSTGNLFTLNLTENPHLGIFGGTGTGKTSYTGYLLVSYALQYQFRVLLLDGKGTADWNVFRNQIEYYKTDYTDFPTYLSLITFEYQRRAKLLSQYGCQSIYDLAAHITAIPRPLLVIIEEFGDLMDQMKLVSQTGYRNLSLELGQLFRKARGVGIHLCIIDQNPTLVPGTIIANLPLNISYSIGGSKGMAIREYSLESLERVGHFQVKNDRYHAWPTYQEIQKIINRAWSKQTLAPLLPNLQTKMKQQLANDSLKVQSHNEEDDDVDDLPSMRMLETSTHEENDDPSPSTHACAHEHAHAPGYTNEQNIPAIPSHVVHAHAHDAWQVDTSLSSSSQIVGEDSHQGSYLLEGEPLTDTEKDLVAKVYKESGQNLKLTCQKLWGSRTTTRKQWVRNVIRERGLL